MVDTRKLVKWGSSKTLIISLPRKWVKQNNLTENQSVKLQNNPDGTLTIIPQDFSNENLETETLIKIKDVDDIENIRFRIITKYLDGWDIIKLETDSIIEFPSNISETIEEIVEPLLGLQILGVNSRNIVIKNIMSIESSNIFNLIKLISDQTISLGNILIGHIENHSDFSDKTGKTEWKNVKQYHYQITREQRRALLRPITLGKMDLSLQDLVDFQFYIFALFNIAEIIKYIIDTGKRYNMAKEDKFGITGLSNSVIHLVRNSIDSFLFKETAKAIDTMKNIKEKRPLKREIENKYDELKTVFTMEQVILDHIEKILDYCEDICLAALRRAI